MHLDITTQPVGTDIISLADMKEFLRVDHSDEDTTITAILNAAVQSCQDYTNRHFTTSNFTYYRDSFGCYEFPVGPINSITSITYQDVKNDTETLDTDYYYSDFKREPARLAFSETFQLYEDTYNAIVVSGTLGEAPAEPIKHAIRLLTAHYYENRRAVITGTIATELPLGVQALLNPYRIISK
jgi:uncharacterized phiE125 gp8 family phage protein